MVTGWPVRIRILEDGTTTGRRLGVAEIRLPAGAQGPPQHRHAEHDEGFYVGSGTVRFTTGTADRDAGPGTLVMIPPGERRTFANAADEPAVVLNTFTPGRYVQYFRDLRDMIASSRPLTRDAMARAMARYATTEIRQESA